MDLDAVLQDRVSFADIAAAPGSPMQALPVIQMFWHGAPLSLVERLSLASFLYHGHGVHLYAYDDIAGVPAGVVLRDAEEIVPRSAMFRHGRTGSLAPFADWFRYRLLFGRGGIWCDMDMVCLKPFDFDRPRLFGWQDDRLINNAVLGLPVADPVAGWMAGVCENPHRPLPYDRLGDRVRKLKRRWLRGNRRGDVKWGETGPGGLTLALRHFGLEHEALRVATFYPVPHDDWQALFQDSSGLDLRDSYAVHLWNNLLVTGGAKPQGATLPAGSIFGRLCSRYLPQGAAEPVATPRRL
jgi:Alpha 1,4-glycosyltransferase conserved region/Glycosyltransferase sugar-binding region containing DXD motif